MALPAMNPAPANLYLETQDVDVKEDLADLIYRIDPDETPLVSALAHEGANQVLTEWIYQKLNPAANVPQPEGFVAVISPAKKPARLNNICQLLARTVGVSGTLRVVEQVGGDEYTRQLMLRGLELRRDVELTISGETVKTIADPRVLSGLQTWCSNGSVGAGAGALPIGDGSNGHTPGTARDLTLNMIEDGIQMAWNAGGKPRMGVMSGTIKRWFSNMAQGGTGNPIVATQMVQSTTPSPITMMGAVAAFLTDFGTMELVPDRFCVPHVIEIIDPDYLELACLPGREFIEEEYAKTGDNTQGGVLWEGTLRATAPEAHCCIWDLNQ